MVNAPAPHPSPAWIAPGPMWGAYGNLADPPSLGRFGRPVILRYASDSFMDEFMATLALQPEQLAAWEARWESWEQPMKTPVAGSTLPITEPLSRRNLQLLRGPVLAGKRAPAQALVPTTTPVPDKPLKLYQPVQNRFYLVSASLVCRRAGLPDRHIDPGKQEQAGFVLRRLLPSTTGASADPPSTWDEYAYVKGVGAPCWQKVTKGTILALGEERLPLFSLAYTDAKAHPRRIFAGLVPVGRREAYIGAGLAPTPVADGSVADLGPDTRLLQFALQVTGPWKEMVADADRQRAKFLRWPLGKGGDSGDSNDQLKTEIRAARSRIQTNSWYVILDLIRFLETHLPGVSSVLKSGSSGVGLQPAEQAIIDFMQSVSFKPGYVSALHAGLTRTDYASASVPADLWLAAALLAGDVELRQALENAELPFQYSTSTPSSWPMFLFPLADPDPNLGPLPFVGAADITSLLDNLTKLVETALPDRSASPQPEIRIPKKMEHADVEAWFIIRCVYERPNCGCLQPPVLSAPTEAFQMASFFDPDAPARQVRIPMPFNISPAGLRKYNKSATLVVSDMLCGQLKRIRQLSLGDLVLSVLPWPFHKDLPEVGPAGSCAEGGNPIGMLCSLSIPIVTLCALILLLVIVALFDLFFRWIPLLFLCFPIPGLASKKPELGAEE